MTEKTEGERTKRQTLSRWVIYVIGMLVLAMGLTLNTKTGLGVSPILSLAYCSTQIWGVNLGDATFVLYALFVIAQLIIRGKRRQWYDLLQLPLSLVFSRVLNLYDRFINYDPAKHGLPSNLVCLALAIIVTGIGVAMTVNMRLVPNPGDGIVQAIADLIGRDQGFAKNCFDLVILSLATLGKITAVGLGTVLAMLFVGRAISLVNHFFKEKMCRAAGMA